MKVALIGPVFPYRGGIAHYTTSLAIAFAKYHEITVISFSRQYPRWLYPGRSDKDPSKEPLRVEAEYLLDPFNLLSWWRTGRRVQSLKPDILILQWWVTFWAPAFIVVALLARVAHIPVMILIHNVLPHEERWWDQILAKITLRKGNSFIVHTQREKQRLLSLVPSAVVAVLPHPIYDMFGDTQIPREIARLKLEQPLDSLVLLFFGLVRPYKGLRYLIDSLAILKERGKTIHLLVAGEFWEDKDSYLQYIDRHHLSPQIKFVDRYIPNEEVGLYFSAADALVAPYVAGTQSGPATLAIDFGLPLIVTDVIADGIPRINKDRLLVVPARNPKALADAIEKLETYPEPQPKVLQEAENHWAQLVKVIEETLVVK